MKPVALILQPWGGDEGAGLVEECASELGLSCEMIQEPLPFDWESNWSKLVKWYGPSLRVAIKGLRSRRSKDVVLSFDPMCGLIFASLARMLHLKTPPMVISMFLLRPWKSEFMDRLRHIFADYGLKRVRKIICFSSYEVARYSREFPRHAAKLAFVPVGTDPTILDLEAEAARQKQEPPQPYVFSGGTTNRDYHTLAGAIRRLPDTRFKIIAKKGDFPGEQSNLEFLDNVYGANYERAVLDSTIVVLPLYDQCFASGQLTLLRAMELGKPVVASDVPGVRDYITDGEDGVLVSAGDEAAMTEAIVRLLDDPDGRLRLGANARETHQGRFTQKMSVSGIIKYAAIEAGLDGKIEA